MTVTVPMDKRCGHLLAPRHGRILAGRIAALAAALSLFAAPCLGAGQSDTDSARPPPDPTPVVFVPPAMGAPGDRIGAGTRDPEAHDLPIRLLVPPRGGLTAKAQPAFYWLLTEPVNGIVRFELRDHDKDRALFVIEDSFPGVPGYHVIDLADFGIRLPAGRIFSWSVKIAGVETNDMVRQPAVSWIERIPPTPAVRAALDRPTDPSAIVVLAAAGLWYDALAAAMAVRVDDPVKGSGDSTVAGLLGQAGLLKELPVSGD